MDMWNTGWNTFQDLSNHGFVRATLCTTDLLVGACQSLVNYNVVLYQYTLW